MACYRPQDAYRGPGGSVHVGYEPPGSTEKLRLPCGSCFGCRMEYAQEWSIRCEHEASCWDHNLFLTLTYADDKLEWHRGLVFQDLQKFLKRLRSEFAGESVAPDGSGKRPIRYFAAGEYGSKTFRPHFHVLLFNLRLPDIAGVAGRNQISSRVSDLWWHGQHTVSGFTPGRARYIAGYSMKKVRGRMARERHYGVIHPETGEVFQREPEGCRMSLRPGIGAYWFDKFRGDLERGYYIERGGFKKRLPRYYREKLLKDDDFAMDYKVRTDAYINAQDPAEDTEERRAVREKVHKARVGARGNERAF